MSTEPKQTAADQELTPEEKYYKKKGYTGSDVALAIIGAGVANAVALLAISTPFTLWNMIVGVTILCILFAFAPAPTAKPRLFVAYAAVWAFSFLSGVGVLFNILFERILGSNSWPNNESTAPFYSLPFNHNLFFNQYYVKNYYVINNQQIVDRVQAFTPINVYDLAFFLTWAVVLFICLLILLYRRKRHLPSDSSKLKPQPGPETQQAKGSGTLTTSEHVSATPKSGTGEVH
jgi:hypothetical protein